MLHDQICEEIEQVGPAKLALNKDNLEMNYFDQPKDHLNV